MKYRGALAIAVMFGLAAGLGGFSVWFHYQQGKRSLEFWGTDTANLIRHAPRVELFELQTSEVGSESGANGERLLVDQVNIPVVRRADISHVRGLVHARHPLIIDANFEWDSSAATAPPVWSHALRFADGERSITLLFDFEARRLRLLDGSQEIRITPALARAEREFLDKKWDEEQRR